MHRNGTDTDTARRYRGEGPQRVADGLGAAEALARRLPSLTADDWDRDDPHTT